MNKLFYVYMSLLMAVLLFSVLSVPLSAQASPNVVEWLNNETPTEEVPAESVEETTVKENSLAGIIGQLALYTLLIVVLIYGLIKFLAARQKNLQPNQAVKLMGGTPLGNNKSLQLIKVGGQIYLIGVGDEVTLIKEFSDAAEITTIEQDFEQQSSFSKKFRKKKNLKQKEPHQEGLEQLFSQSLNKQKTKQQSLEKEFGQGLYEQEGRRL
ncbi:flagella biosynthesis protein FliZ [Planococcus donghaensis MPA1U2]|uniref:Flagella biosynthesis protein FliZ n=1 Tax=Planococcus donghaensis MPA1U2 TaxID=933115 RepID=E7RJ17_9BACL|nr:flagellar biosynthetic protein FliO [Planococcus donghaensis]EGA89027.1 flagella biosynthesis protein FliZ [Planococcus donghaensis MPA1U2]